MVCDQLRVEAGGQGQHAQQDQGRGFRLGTGALRRILAGLAIRLGRGQLANLIQEGGGMKEGEDGSEVGLEQFEQGLPDLDGEDGRVEDVDIGLAGILGGRPREADGLSRALSLGTVPVAVAVITVDSGSDVSFRTAGADGGLGIDADAARRLAGAAGGVDTGIDAFDFAPATAGAGNAGAHCREERWDVIVIEWRWDAAAAAAVVKPAVGTFTATN